jgi:thiamine biosynthesis protein ThiC
VARVAAYIGDTIKHGLRVTKRDMEVSKARRAMDWESQFHHMLFPEVARTIREERMPRDKATCTMCGAFCANKGAH